MHNALKNILGVISIITLAAFAYASYEHGMVKMNESYGSFNIEGEGKIVAIPDVVEFRAGVLTEGGMELSDLYEENNKKISGLVSYLKDLEIDEKDIKTSSFYINPRYSRGKCMPIEEGGTCPPPEIVGYSINQNIHVKVRDIDAVSDILSGVVKNGANNVSGINFTIDDPKTLQDEAREMAIKNAKERASKLAKAGGFTLGPIKSINESFGGSPYPVRFDMAGKGGGEMVESMASIKPSIEAGSQEIVVRVNISYGIK